MSFYNDTRTDNERHLEYELEESRRREQQRADEDRERRQDALRERLEEARAEQHHAETWEEAFAKGIYLYDKEARDEIRDNAQIAALIATGQNEHGDKPETYFQDLAPKVRRMKAIYQEESAAIEEEIKRLRASMLGRVADRIEAELQEAEFAQAFREDNPEYLVNW